MPRDNFATIMPTAPAQSDLFAFVTPAELETLVTLARREDMGPDARDLTSELFIPATLTGRALFRARKPGQLAGVAIIPTVARLYDPRLTTHPLLTDGSALHADQALAEVAGPLRSLLAMERVALNFLTHLSGIASLTARYRAATAGTRAVICDTRKTIPGLRQLAKYAVVCGGGVSHRLGLYDAVLIKDNHLAHLGLPDLAQAVQQAVARARVLQPAPKFVQVEVDTLAQLERVLPVQPDMVLLDNMTPDLLRQAVALRDRVAPNVQLEASGGVNLDTVRDIARTGVDRISIGALTHSAPALDIGLDVLHA